MIFSEAGLGMKPCVATRKVCSLYDECRRNAGILLDLKRQIEKQQQQQQNQSSLSLHSHSGSVSGDGMDGHHASQSATSGGHRRKYQRQH